MYDSIKEEYPFVTYFDYLIIFNKLSNRQVAQLCECDVHTVWLYRNGKRFPRFDVVLKIAQAFNLSDRECRYLFCRYNPNKGFYWIGKNED